MVADQLSGKQNKTHHRGTERIKLQILCTSARMWFPTVQCRTFANLLITVALHLAISRYDWAGSMSTGAPAYLPALMPPGPAGCFPESQISRPRHCPELSAGHPSSDQC